MHHSRRGAGDKKSCDKADAANQKAQKPHAHCDDRHADRKRPVQPLVAVRLFEQGTAGQHDGVQSVLPRLGAAPRGLRQAEKHDRAVPAQACQNRYKKIISDLPDKLEQVDYVALSAKQAVLYRKLLAETEDRINNTEGMQRRGLVLSLLLHLKQICNHPDQYLGTEEYSPAQSGKFEMLRQLAQTISEKRERVLVFTQFRDLTGYLDDYLAEIFGRRGGVIHGGVIHGGVPVRERNEIVERFQSEAYVPYLVLSVKAGGTGLNLTNANHVIHFDRWWNPSVEYQATDRAFRIGQDKNVMVHKFVCKGSVEEKIDALINSKKELAENVIGAGGESWITEMNNDELMNLLRLEV